ncbi:hypothetical protein WA026_012065 [Henosepilachna vigintioctopunctata]|uniref:Uncharacterized protein n=1 Tax=Henosepilachna vigintioctopunctata TaxID=420089 RepID=A0AAW1VE36_9CUCU
MLIELLKENRKSTTVELVEPNHNVATPQGPVTVPGRKRVLGDNKEAGRVSPMKVRTPTRSIRSPSEGGIFQGSSTVTADQSFAGAVRRAWLHDKTFHPTLVAITWSKNYQFNDHCEVRSRFRVAYELKYLHPVE